MNDVFIYKKDGAMNIIYLTGLVPIQEYMENYLDKENEYHVFDKTSLPNINYIKAWDFNDDKTAVIVNMPKARDIHRTALRSDRVPRLATLDVAYMRALERGDSTAAQEIAAQKQTLRDIPAHPAIDAAQTPEELMALTLDVLLTQ